MRTSMDFGMNAEGGRRLSGVPEMSECQWEVRIHASVQRELLSASEHAECLISPRSSVSQHLRNLQKSGGEANA
jgi:hypothetical protein